MSKNKNLIAGIIVAIIVAASLMPVLFQKPTGSGPFTDSANPSVQTFTPYVSGYYRGSADFQINNWLEEKIQATTTNPADITTTNNNTQFDVNSTSSASPESYGYWLINLTYLQSYYLWNSSGYFNITMSTGGGTSYSYGGVKVVNTFTVGGALLLTASSYDSSSKSTLDFNGTTYSNNFGLPTFHLNFTNSGLKIYSSESGSNGAYVYSQTFSVHSGILNITSTDPTYTSSGTNKAYGWNVAVSPYSNSLSNGVTTTFVNTAFVNGLGSYWLVIVDGTTYNETSASFSLSLQSTSPASVQELSSPVYLTTQSSAVSYPLTSPTTTISLNYQFNPPLSEAGSYAYKVINNGSAFTGEIQLNVTNQGIFDFNTSSGVPSNVIFTYENGTVIKGIWERGPTGIPSTYPLYWAFLNVSLGADSTNYLYMEVFPAIANVASTVMNGSAVGAVIVNVHNTTQISWSVNYGSTVTTDYTITDNTASFGGEITFTLHTNIVNRMVFWTQGLATNPDYTSQYSNLNPFTEIQGDGTNTGFGYYVLPNSSPSYLQSLYVLNGTQTDIGSQYTGTDFTANYNMFGEYYNGTYTFNTPVGLFSQQVSPFNLTGKLASGENGNGYQSFSSFGYFQTVPIPHPIQFEAVGLGGGTVHQQSSGNYVQFNEHGLPLGKQWTVTVQNLTKGVDYPYSTTQNVQQVFLPASVNYSFSVTTAGIQDYNVVNKTGIVYLSSSSNASVNVTFVNVTHYVNFIESGLSSGTTWSVTLNGTTESSQGSQIQFIMRNGTYSYSVTYPYTYDSNVSSGSLTVNGSQVNVYVGFTYTAFSVTLQDEGLPSTTQWSVVISGQTYLSNTSAGNTILLKLRAGSYSASVNNASYLTPVNKYLNFSVSGNEQFTVQFAILLTFIAQGYTGTWHVSVNGVYYTSSTNTIVAKVSPGQVTYQVQGVTGYYISPIYNQITLSQSQTINVQFTQHTTNYFSIFSNVEFIAILFVVLLALGVIGMLKWRGWRRR